MTRIKAWHKFAGFRLRILLGLMLCALPCDANRANSTDPDGQFPIFIISFEDSGTVNINISHYLDLLSGNDATGNVINIHSRGKGIYQHGDGNVIPELKFVLPIQEAGGSKSDIKSKLINMYRQWDKKHPDLLPSIVR